MARLVARVTRLEREAHRWRLAVLTGGVLLAAFALMGQSPSPNRAADRIEAREFVLRDAKGGTRARLQVKPDGLAALLHLLDPAARPRVELGVGSDATPSLRLADAAGKLRAAFHLEADGRPGLALTDGAGRLRWRVP